MREQSDLPPERRWTFLDDERPLRIPGWLALWSLGGLGLLTALVPYLPQLAFLGWIDLPVTVLIFVSCVWIALADRAIGRLGMLGLWISLAAVGVSVLRLLTDRNHPWQS